MPQHEITNNQDAYNQFWIEHSRLGLNTTKFLAHRDLPYIFCEHLLQHNIKVKYKVLDFGCGSGATAKVIHDMLQMLGVDVELYGLDINEKNVAVARKENPAGKFEWCEKGKVPAGWQDFDLVICNFVLLENKFDDMLTILKNINGLLNDKGIAIITSNTAKTYDRQNQWNSFNTNHPENTPTVFSPEKNKLKRVEGQSVKKTMHDKNGKTLFTFFDIFHPRHVYKKAYELAGLSIVASRKPLGTEHDGIEWKSETHTPPYRIDVIRKNQSAPALEQVPGTVRLKAML